MSASKKTRLSVLDLVPIHRGQQPNQAIESMVQLVRATEKLGYHRYWIAEHHNMPSIISSATVILIKHALENSETIRVGAGGIMLPNHSPLVVAEQFGTMATIYPNRIDLGLGRAPGTDQLTAQALRRSRRDSVHSFPNDVKDLITYFGPEEQQSNVKAFPGVGTNVPIYILGSSTNSAILAAEMGLPYSFAGHFAPSQMKEAIALYRASFKPSQFLQKPYVIIGLNVIAADTHEEVEVLFAELFQQFLNTSIVHNKPFEDLSPAEQEQISSQMGIMISGDQDAVTSQLIDFQKAFEADELMVGSYIYNQEKKIRSYEILKEAYLSISTH
ncbi:LLM class flavin-dependent oxidoreductase [Paenibacillus xylanexedens]|uniref:LLM class flavin-dependent oxidoreductase n=1 Tax=Paenibacillus xylanexedens TaxID=528191 RepID=UPI0011A43A22|nr:LLM class flavin-dependent oxidoreductase [Paenibacillus xylanexedens]